jgi:DNA-binding MarR family transcriptional regulator
VARQASEEDRRAQVLHVTAKGAELVRKATRKMARATARPAAGGYTGSRSGVRAACCRFAEMATPNP